MCAMSEGTTSTSARSATGVAAPVLDEVQSGVFDPTAPAVEKHYLLAVTDDATGRAFVRGLRRWVTSEQDVADAPDPEAMVRVNVGFTAAGLSALGLDPSTMASFPAEFLDGMAARSLLLGDIGESSPSHWDAAYTAAGGPHIWLMVQGPDVATIAPTLSSIDAAIAAARLTVLGTEEGAQLGAAQAPAKEHFGFNDNLSQPGVEGVGQTVHPGQGTPVWTSDGPTTACHGPEAPTWESIPAGCFVLGYPNGYGQTPSQPADVDLRMNSTFMVLRKLEQDVAGFRTTVNGWATQLDIDPELMAAKLVGRWRSGVPLELSPDKDDPSIMKDPETANAFVYGGPGCPGRDADGVNVPRLAHIRRVNPRDALGKDSVVQPRNHRIIRRSAPYGPWLPEGSPDDGTARGLLFRAFNASILDQFELVQSQWVNSANEASGLSSDRDPFAGSIDTTLPTDPGGNPTRAAVRQQTSSFNVPTADGSCPTLYGLPRFVTVKGGAYLFVPSLSALTRIGRDAPVAPPHVDPLQGLSFTQAYAEVSAGPWPEKEKAAKLTEVVMYFQQKLVGLGNDLRSSDATAVFPTVAGVLLGAWQDAAEVLDNASGVFSVAPGYGARLNDVTGPFILGMDKTPEYDKQLGMMQAVAPTKDLPAITAWLDDYADKVVTQIIERVPTGAPEAPFDVVQDVAVRTALAWVGQYFGVPGPNDATMITWLRAIGIDVFEFWSPMVPGVQDATAQMAAQLEQYIDGLIEVRLAEMKAKAGGADIALPDDVLGRLVAIATDADPIIDLLDVRRNLAGFALGSSVALSSNIAFAVGYFLDPANTKDLTTLRKAITAKDDGLIAGCMLEAVRLAAPSPPSIFRVTLADTTIAAGTPRAKEIPAGSVIIINPAVAMTDPAVFGPDPSAFDPTHPVSNYLVFGRGQHVCFGTAIAVAMLSAVGKALFGRPGLVTAVRPQQGTGFPGEFYPSTFPAAFLLAAAPST
jgi:cytochrome P450/deferrochelatase/peroxidase EfeB